MRQLFVILLFVIPMASFGQLITNPGVAPGTLVQNVLLGSGVTVSNISYSGSPIAIGSFDGSATNLGLASGVVLTTGTTQNNGSGPHGPNNSSGSGVDNNVAGNSLLSQQIGGVDTYNAAILEFDFIPYSDTVSFRYVFGSEEYPEYVNAGFNDVFAFFISGPGIAGLQNIARLPSGQVVSIDNVNAGSNAALFVNNGDGNSAPQNGSPQYIQYDGFTRVLTAESQVQCGETYHLIIAIADAGDGILDSGIFLEANSLTSKTPIEITHTLSQDVFNDPDVMAEGCVTTTVTLERGPNDLASAMTIPINLSGTATELVDYSDIPASVTFPAGVQQVQFTFDAFQDGLAEGQENILMTFPILDPCGNPNPLELELFINDVEPVAVDIVSETVQCPGDSVILTAQATGGAAPYVFIWNTGFLGPSITVAPQVTTTYSVAVTDACLGQTVLAAEEVIIPVFDPLTINETPDITEICPYITATIEANPTGGSGNYTYEWSSSFDSDIGSTNAIDVTPSTTTTYTVIVTDNCGNKDTADVVYTITSPPLELTMTPDVKICPWDSVQIGVTSTGGFGQHYYLWPHSGETTSEVWVSPLTTTNYTVIVSDECQTFTVEGTTQVEVVKPTAEFTISSETVFNNLPIQFQNLSQDAISYEWDFGDNNSSTIVHPQNTYDDPGIYVVTLIATDELGCKDTISKPLEVEEEWYIYIPNTFTPDGNRFNNDFRASTVGIQTLSINIFNRWGEVVFTSNDLNFAWDGSYNGQIVGDGTFTYKVRFLTNSERRKTIVGHVNVLK